MQETIEGCRQETLQARIHQPPRWPCHLPTPSIKHRSPQVVDLEIQKVKDRLARKHILLTLDQKAKDFLVEKGYQPEMGARPIRRVIETYLEDPLAEKLLQNPDKAAHRSLLPCKTTKSSSSSRKHPRLT